MKFKRVFKYALCGLCMLLGLFTLLGVVLIRVQPGFGPGMFDSSIELPNGYILSRTSGNEIKVHSTRLGNSKVYSENGTLISSTPEIPPKVVEIAWDKRFIIAKQYNLKHTWPNLPKGYPKIHFPDKLPEGYPMTCYSLLVPDKTISNYWIVDTSIDKVYGPFDKSGFAKQRVILSVPDTLILKSVDSYKKKH